MRRQQRRHSIPNELKPAASDPPAGDASTAAAVPDPNELKPDVAPTDQPAPAPAQVNEIGQGGSGNQPAADASTQDMASDKDIASSKHKKKKGLAKYIPLPNVQ